MALTERLNSQTIIYIPGLIVQPYDFARFAQTYQLPGVPVQPYGNLLNATGIDKDTLAAYPNLYDQRFLNPYSDPKPNLTRRIRHSLTTIGAARLSAVADYGDDKNNLSVRLSKTKLKNAGFDPHLTSALHDIGGLEWVLYIQPEYLASFFSGMNSDTDQPMLTALALQQLVADEIQHRGIVKHVRHPDDVFQKTAEKSSHTEQKADRTFTFESGPRPDKHRRQPPISPANDPIADALRQQLSTYLPPMEATIPSFLASARRAEIMRGRLLPIMGEGQELSIAGIIALADYARAELIVNEHIHPAVRIGAKILSECVHKGVIPINMDQAGAAVTMLTLDDCLRPDNLITRGRPTNTGVFILLGQSAAIDLVYRHFGAEGAGSYEIPPPEQRQTSHDIWEELEQQPVSTSRNIEVRNLKGFESLHTYILNNIRYSQGLDPAVVEGAVVFEHYVQFGVSAALVSQREPSIARLTSLLSHLMQIREQTALGHGTLPIDANFGFGAVQRLIDAL